MKRHVYINTRRLLLAALILCASPALAKTVSVTGVVLDQSGTSAPTVQKLSFAAGETSEIDLTVTHPDGTAYNLTGAQVLFAVNGSVISRQATIDNAAAGTAHVPLVIADTIGLLGVYTYDISVTVSSGAFYRAVPASSFVVTAGIGQPGQPVTVPASQQPLAQGPAGPAGNPKNIYVAGAQQASEPGLNFSTGVSCSDNPGSSRLDCSVSGGSGSVTSVACGTGMSCSPSPITTTGTVSLANTAVTAGSYGDAAHSLAATVDAQGRLTSLVANAITIAESAVTGLVSDLAGKAPTTRLVSAGTGLSGGGDLSADRTLSLANTAVTPGSYTNTNLTVDAQGRITAASNGSGGGITGTLTTNRVPYASNTTAISDGDLAFDGTHTYTVQSGTILNFSAATAAMKGPAGGVQNLVAKSTTEMVLSTTSNTVVTTTTPAASGLYLVMVYYRIFTGPSNLTVTVNYNDDAGSQTQTVVSQTAQATGAYVVQPVMVDAHVAPLDVEAIAGTANRVIISAAIVRLN